MKHPFVLVHGAYHGAWCFEKLMACMEAAGEQVRAVDLPLCPDRATPVSMEDCLRVLEAAIPQGERVILCGHSNGGHFITAFAQRHPDRVAALVYITATLLPDGCSAFDNPTVEDACPKTAACATGSASGIRWRPRPTTRPCGTTFTPGLTGRKPAGRPTASNPSRWTALPPPTG